MQALRLLFPALGVSLCILGGGCGDDGQSTEEIIRSKIGDQDASLGFTAIVPEFVPESCLENPRANATELDELAILLFSTTGDSDFSRTVPSVQINEELVNRPSRFPDGSPIRYLGDQPFAVRQDVSEDGLASMQYVTKFGNVEVTTVMLWDAAGNPSAFQFSPEMKDVADRIIESMVDNARKLGIPPPVDASVAAIAG